ncbi:restriction endonuclease subunit S [Janthinobacterium sp. GMG2]|uniref:restriction endonuclease subunit S n=1 Tax=Janthinobacterium sp. GMG2 TaxID=3096606 RepID=UPI0029F580A7|nr:restriction endonuclease subunit S [Janthinobacterium sp. GMG2]MDX8122629.1 restriction endonuclease subunit S [Janthinobacterium sp. GMG2]
MFPKDWQRSTLGKIAQITSGGTPDRANADYWDGDVPWVTTGEIQFNTINGTLEKITELGLKNSAAKRFPVDTLLMAMYGQGKTRGQVAKLGIEAATNQACAAILLRDGYDTDFYFQYLSFQYEALRELGNAGTQQNLSGGILKMVPVPILPLKEQRRIANILTTWDKVIASTERLIANSLRQKKMLAQRMLTGKVRLQGFSTSVIRRETPYGSLPEDWAYLRIEEVAVEVSQKLGDVAPYPVLSCTKHHGLVDSLNYFKKQVFSLDTSTYKVIPKNCFVYATNHIDEGSIGYQNLYDFGLVSPMYTSFKTNDNILDSYLFALLKTEHYRQIFASATNASVDRRGSLRWKDFRKLHIPVPSISEQKAIAKVLVLADRDADLMQRKLDLLRKEKSALMTQLLTGKRRVHLSDSETVVSA